MSEQDNGQVSTLQRPTSNNREDWKAYWKQQGQHWRTEIDEMHWKNHPDLRGIHAFVSVRYYKRVSNAVANGK